MTTIGITGGIGSGKSLMCKVMQTFDLPVFNADEEVRNLYNHDENLKQYIISCFGEDLYKDNMLKTNALAQIIFNDNQALQKLTKQAYPALWQQFVRWRSRQHYHAVIMEAALLYESGLYKQVDFIVNVSAPQDVRISRVLGRNKGLTKDDVMLRIRHQYSDEQRCEHADFIIVNDNKTAVTPQIMELLHKINTISAGII
jgi:dephospho-CoA kinase